MEGASPHGAAAPAATTPSKSAQQIIKPVRKHIRNAKEEARIARRISQRLDTRRFARFHRAFAFGENFVLVFERLGTNLYDLLKENGRKGFPIEVVREWARQLFEGLKQLHALGYVHTDLKVD